MGVKKLFVFVVIMLSAVVLSQRSHAVNDGTLPRQGTVPTTQSTVDMDSEGESGKGSEGLLAPTLDMSNPADRQKLLANFDREREMLKSRGLSEDEIADLKDAIINGDMEKIKKAYGKKVRNNGGEE